MAGAGGEFGQGGQFLLIERLPKAVFQGRQARQRAAKERQPVGRAAQRGRPAAGDRGAAAARGLDVDPGVGLSPAKTSTARATAERAAGLPAVSGAANLPG